MFSKESRIEKFKDAETVIGSSIKVKGNFQGKGNIVIDGMLEGSVKTEANLFIGEEARVVANIESLDSSIHGEVHGNIKSRGYLAIGKTAKIFGDIQYAEISIEKGALINGQLIAVTEDNKRGRGRKEEVEELESEE